jgi:D-amino-acid oxidase
MMKSVAVVGAGVSGLTSGVVLAERGHRVSIFAEEIGQQTTSGAAAAIWFPYDCEPQDKVIAWSLATYQILADLSRDPQTGVTMLELRQFARAGELPIPNWAKLLGAQPLVIPRPVEEFRCATNSQFPVGFTSGFSIRVPLTDTSRYLDYLRERFLIAGGTLTIGLRFSKLEDVPDDFSLIVNCAGIGARELVSDADVEPHRGQIAIVPKLDLSCAIVSDDSPLMYAIPRAHDCVFGGTNSISHEREPIPSETTAIVDECSRLLQIEPPRILAERVGLRPYRKSGVRLERETLSGGRAVIHNYGHGGSGFTLSWGCAEEVLALASR